MSSKTTSLVAVLVLLAASGAHAEAERDLSAFTREAKAKLQDQMRDPGSVQFRNLFISRHEPDGQLFLCGEMNAKNGYGGYDGFRPFISSTGAMVYAGSQIDALVEEYCGHKIAPAK